MGFNPQGGDCAAALRDFRAFQREKLLIWMGLGRLELREEIRALQVVRAL